jgi:hypothetical protein
LEGDTTRSLKIHEVHNFYRLLTALEEKVHDCTHITVLQAVTHLTWFKSKDNFSNQCYNDIVKFVIDLIPVKHNMPKDLKAWDTICEWWSSPEFIAISEQNWLNRQSKKSVHHYRVDGHICKTQRRVRYNLSLFS